MGVVAVDPTSPYSGGALLGDRIRMNDIATDPGIFIRSMATRGSLGGLATTTKEVVDLMDAEGNTPDPHVGDAGDDKSIRRTGAQTWEVEDEPQPGLCPPY